jgi:hypothetical protein
MKRHFAWLAAFAASFVIAALAWSAQPKSNSKKPDDAAVERARRTVQMLDEIYKQTIVLVTDKYVNKPEDFAAGSAAVLLFKNLSKSGHQQVRLVDATGEPYEEGNAPQDAFEKEGVKKLRSGAKIHDQVVAKDNGKYELRAMTPVPVVMDKCVMCHDNYKAAKQKGEVIGAISYIIPIEP